MANFSHYLLASWHSIRRAPLPYLLTLLILGLGLGSVFSTSTIYYWLSRDPLPNISQQLYFAKFNSPNSDCQTCPPPRVLSYQDLLKLQSSDIAKQSVGMYSSEGYAKADPQSQIAPTRVQLRVTQPSFFSLFAVPIAHGQVFAPNSHEQVAVISSNIAQQFFGRTDVVGERFGLDGRLFTVVAVLAPWQMVPRLYDVNNGRAMNPVEDIYLPLETGLDLGYQANSQSQTFDSVDYSRYREVVREQGIYFLQIWLKLEDQQQVNQYQQFLDNLVVSEKAAGRHVRPANHGLVPMADIQQYFNSTPKEASALTLVSLLFLFVCLFNASQLSLNRYLANHYEFALRRALGASRWAIQAQFLVDVLLTSLLALLLAVVVALLGSQLIQRLFNLGDHLTGINLGIGLAMAALSFASCYLVSLYPSLRVSFSPLSQQLKE